MFYPNTDLCLQQWTLSVLRICYLVISCPTKLIIFSFFFLFFKSFQFIFETKTPSHRRGDVNRMKALMDRRGWAQGELALLSIIVSSNTTTTKIINTTTIMITLLIITTTTIITTATSEPLNQRSRWRFLKTEEAIKWYLKTIRINQHQ